MVYMISTIYQWPFQEPKLEVPTIYKAYVREYPQKIWPYMVQYLHFRILKFPLNIIYLIQEVMLGKCWVWDWLKKGMADTT
jgi:hypothetical protein